MTQNDSLVIDWQGEEKDRIGELVCTLEVDQSGLADFEAGLAEAVSKIDPAIMGSIRELSRAVEEIAKSGMHISLDMYQTYGQAADAVPQAAEYLSNLWQPIIDNVTKFWSGMIDIYERYYICELACREYVVKLNWKRGRGKKLSWRSLNHQQRRDAISEYLAKHGPMSLQ